MSFWTDPDWEGSPSEGRLLWVYLLTSELSHGITGVYPLTKKQIFSATNLKGKALARGFNAIGDRVRRYEGAWLWVVKRFDHIMRKGSPNHMRAAVKYLSIDVPAPIRADFLALYASSDIDRKYGYQLRGLQGACKGLSPTPSPVPTPSPSPNGSVASRRGAEELGKTCGRHSTYRPLTGGDPESLD